MNSNQGTWLVTGGLGFIGSHFIRLVLRERPKIDVINFDAMTYCGNPETMADVAPNERYRFIHGNICDRTEVEAAFSLGVKVVVNFAAETHVDRSILAPERFLRTDILGTHTLLEVAHKHSVERFLQVSTDEVYGHIESGRSIESDPIAPRSPYAASKAGGDLQALAYAATFGTPTLVTRGSNTYGPYQFPEKLIPLFITNLLDDQPVPVYGDGLQIRDWIYVEDHARGILQVLERGAVGNVYNLGGGNSHTNLDITERLLALCGRARSSHVHHVTDRQGHDRRYALDSSKARNLGWAPCKPIAEGLAETVRWYRDREAWWRPIKSGDFVAYYDRQYTHRQRL